MRRVSCGGGAKNTGKRKRRAERPLIEIGEGSFSGGNRKRRTREVTKISLLGEDDGDG